MNVVRTASAVFALLGGLVLSGCGGGGGGGDTGPVTSTLDFPVGAAKSAFMLSSRQFNLAGSLDGTNYTMSFSIAPGAPATFEGHAASTAIQTAIVRANGAVVSQTTTVSYFSTNPFVGYGGINQGTGSYSVFNQIANLPTTAKVGQSGAIGTGVEYTNSSKIQVLNTTTVTWSLEADTATTAFACQNVQISGTTPATGSDCYKIDSNGNVLGLVSRVTVNGKTLTLS